MPRAHLRSEQEGRDVQEDCIGKVPRARSHCLYSILLSWTSRGTWISVLPQPSTPEQLEVQSLWSKKSIAIYQKFQAVPADTRADQRRLSTRGPTTSVPGTALILGVGEALSIRGKLPQAAIPIPGEPHTPSFQCYFLTPVPDTTVISDGKNVR